MSAPIWVAHLGSTLAMTGLIWLVQVVHYPLFSAVGGEAFPGYHAAHTRLITWIVLPLMTTELLTAMWLVASPPPEVGRLYLWTGFALVLVIWGSTALLQVPQHGALSAGFDPEVHRALVASNWIRTAAWTARAALVLYLTASMLNPRVGS